MGKLKKVVDQITEICYFVFNIIAFLWFMAIIFLLIYLFSYYIFDFIKNFIGPHI